MAKEIIRLIPLLFLISLSFAREVEILAGRVYTDETGRYRAEGEVEIFYGEFYIRADRAVYDPVTREVSAYGSVYIRRLGGQFEIRGREARMNMDTMKGTFVDAEGKVGRFYFSAKRVERIDRETFYIFDGDVTTCPPDKKQLKVCFWKAAITGQHVFSFSNRLKLFNLPIAYAPLILFPVGERRSGLLPPMIGSNTYNTFIYRQPLYWAISPDKDMTLTFDYRDIQAKGLSLEYRQAVSGKEFVYFNTMYYREPEPPGEWWTGREQDTFRRDRYRIEFEARIKDLKFGLDVPSDPYFFEDVYYNQPERAIPFTLSYLSYSDTGRDYLFTFTLRNFYDLTSPDNRNTLNLLPELSFYRKPEKFGPFYLNLTATFTNFWREEGLKAQRLLLRPEIELPVALGTRNNYTRIELINNFYYTSEPYEDTRVNTFYLENRTPLFLNFSAGDLSFLNTFELVYSYSPTTYENPQLDSYDNVVRQNNLSGRLANTVLFRGGAVSSLFVQGGYNLLRSYRFPTDAVLIEEPLLPLRVRLSLFPASWLTLSQDTTYDLNLNVSASSVSSLSLGKGGNRLSLSYATTRSSQDRKLTDQFMGSLSLDYRGLILGGTGTYDTISEKVLYATAYLGYRGPCYFIKVDVRRTYYQNLGDYINEIFLVFNIFNLRDFKLPIRRR